MIIRLAKAQDYAQWLPLWQGYQTFYKTNIPEAVTQQTWRRFLDPAEPMYCAVAEQDCLLVGMVHYIFHRSCWTSGDYVYLQDLFATPELRGKGVGRALIERIRGSKSAGRQPRLVAHPRDQHRCHAPLRQDRRQERLHSIQKVDGMTSPKKRPFIYGCFWSTPASGKANDIVITSC